MNNAAIEGPQAGDRKSVTAVAAAVGAVLQLAVGFFTFTAIGLVAVPVWAIAVLGGAWLAGAVALWRTVARAPVMALVVPAANALVLWGVVAAGGAWLGWSA